jgi:hypothetical protein
MERSGWTLGRSRSRQRTWHRCWRPGVTRTKEATPKPPVARPGGLWTLGGTEPRPLTSTRLLAAPGRKGQARH